MALLDGILGRFNRRRVPPQQTAGVAGVRVVGGFVDEEELERSLRGDERYKTFSDLLANVSIVAASTRYFLNLVAKVQWRFEAAEADRDGQFAERAERMLTEDPATPWHRIVRRAAMYRFYGFSVQEWTARRDEEGALTFADVAPRPQLTIERWDVEETGEVRGVVQRAPVTQREIYLPRPKLVYLVDDTLSDSPEGLGVFRHLAKPGRTLKRFEQLEGFGFETDLRGIPLARAPFTELAKLVEQGRLSKAERERIEAPLREFLEEHVKTPSLGLLLDSIPYEGEDDAATPSSVRQWDLELLSGGNTTQEQIAASISRLNHEMARIMGTEGLLLGGDKVGSLALSRDKSHNLFLIVDGALLEIGEQFALDLLDPLWRLNGWPPETKPTMKHEAVQFRDVTEISAALRDMATAGAVLDPRDPAIAQVRDLLGLSRPPVDLALEDEADAALGGGDGEDDDPIEPETASEAAEEGDA